MEEKFRKIKDIVERELNLKKDSTHDIHHVMRVYNLAMTLAKTENNVNLEILQAGALLHDIGSAKETEDSSGKIDHAVIGAEMAGPILKNLGFSDNDISHIQECILTHRYRTERKSETIEAKIVHDADKLDAVGAIGIARAFTWISKHNACIYKKVDSIEEYIKENLTEGKINGRLIDKSKHSIHINYEIKEKFLLDYLYTETAKKIGQKRLIYYKEFLDRLENEVLGKI